MHQRCRTDHEYTCGLARPDQRLDERESLERLAKARIIGEDAPAERTVCDTVHPFHAEPLVTLQTPRQLIVHHSQAMCRAEHAPLLGPVHGNVSARWSLLIQAQGLRGAPRLYGSSPRPVWPAAAAAHPARSSEVVSGEQSPAATPSPSPIRSWTLAAL